MISRHQEITMNRIACLALTTCLLATAPLVDAAGSREQSLIESVDRAASARGEQKHRPSGPRHAPDRGRGRDHHPGRGHGHAPRHGHAPQHRRAYAPRRHRISEYDARRIAIHHYGLGVRSAHCHDGYWTLVGHRHGHGAIRVVLDAFSGQVVGYFPLDPHRGWRW
ncbi:MAG: hypothetical protein CMP06_03135 [Xanthomonadales bacterium]|nr:hypothetical protein [Xanthomonadales bacterium]